MFVILICSKKNGHIILYLTKIIIIIGNKIKNKEAKKNKGTKEMEQKRQALH